MRRYAWGGWHQRPLPVSSDDDDDGTTGFLHRRHRGTAIDRQLPSAAAKHTRYPSIHRARHCVDDTPSLENDGENGGRLLRRLDVFLLLSLGFLLEL
ncbi:unnamed protein product [Nippostrongylus brasiliensis]|uniref:Uncharacterized protein n=1 Tax=Nippostrongylus brasiliensis TaxID=27835 RepID=A0A0N4YUT1_NIPBR|nr:unnamed protein product [Nippostrongylus brasiliensis]